MTKFHWAILAAAVLLLVVACGGDTKSDAGVSGAGPGTGAISEKEARAAANRFFLTFFGVLSGKQQPQSLIDLYAPECRKDVKASDLAGVLGLVRLFVPGITNMKIEDVDLGKLKLEETKDGTKVVPEDPNKVRIKVEGKFVNIDEYFKGLGFDDNNEDPANTNDPILLVRREGKIYVGDCDSLSDLTGPAITSPGGATPTPSARSSATAIAQASRPGGSRGTAVTLGQSLDVDGQWQLTVVKVDRDAWVQMRTSSSLSATPAATERLVIITVRAKNVATNAQKAEKISDFDFRLTGSLNQLYNSYDQKNSCGFIRNEIDADLFPGGQTEGDVCFRVPRDETGLLLVWRADFGDKLSFFRLD